MGRTATCVWRISAALVTALDEQFGEPVDAYVNGSQTWLRDDGPAEETIEWRLHPVPGYRRPDGVGTHEVFDTVALAIARGEPLPGTPDGLWDGLEAFAPHDPELEPAGLAAACTEALGLAPDAAGLVDHERIGDAWESSGGQISIVNALFDELTS